MEIDTRRKFYEISEVEMRQKVFLRPANDQDADFLEEIYAESRREEFARAGFDELQLKAFLKMQFDFQTEAYKMQFPDAEFFVIVFDEENAGRLIVSRGAPEIRLIEIIVLQKFRGRGIGGFMLEKLKKEARNAGKPLSLRVLKTNVEAVKLYERFGFEIVENDQIFLAMEWRTGAK